MSNEVSSTVLEPDSLLTSAEVAKLLQVDATSIINWSTKGYLQYYRTPGGHRRIRASDVVAFLKQRGMPIPQPLTGIDEKRVVVVEHDAKAMKDAKRLLEPYQHVLKQIYTQSPVEALLDVATFRPHMLVLDASVGGLNALEIVQQLKQKPETQNVDIVLIADSGDKDYEKRAVEVGAIGVITRPLPVNYLLQTLGLEEKPS